MNKKTTRLLLAAAVAAAVSMPVVAQVKNAPNSAASPQPSPVQPPSAAGQLPAPAKTVEVDPNKVIASAGDVTVTAGEFNTVAAGLPPQYSMAMAQQPALRKRLAESILQVKLLSAEARRLHLDQTPQVKQQLEFQDDQVLAQALAKQVQGGQDEKADRAYFDSHKSSFDQLKARHILIRTPDSPAPQDPAKKPLTDAQAKAKAEQIKQRLDKGEDFGAIAKAESDDAVSGKNGGDLGTFAAYKMDTTFSEAAQGLKKNQISDPVRTQFGYHIIQLLDDQPQTYDQAKGQIGEVRMQALLAKLKGKAQYDNTFLGEAGPTAAPTQTPAAANGHVVRQPPSAKGG